MKLFISYARVDKPYCVQIAETLDIHEIWYDQRLYAGQEWWKEILLRLEWCQGFVYLMSPDSLASEYCQKEFKLAFKSGRPIFPVLIHPDARVPEQLARLQYVDLSRGLTADGMKMLLNSIFLAERRMHHGGGRQSNPVYGMREEPPAVPSTGDTLSVIGDAADAMESGDYDKAVYLLRRARESGYRSRFIDLDGLLREAEAALERQTRLREVEREYRSIAELVTRKRTRGKGCEAFNAFRRVEPNYDPDDLSTLCAAETQEIEMVSSLQVHGNGSVHGNGPAPSGIMATPQRPRFQVPGLEWCDIPAGTVLLSDITGNGKPSRSYAQPLYIEAFRLARYPITNLQYQYFLQDEDGYNNPKWWGYSAYAQDWRSRIADALAGQFKGDDRPRENVTWYEAMAFCYWLSEKMELPIMLPTKQQWRRAAQGDDGRIFPFGNEFHIECCNTRESRIRMTTLVMRYDCGVSPFGVYDMAGNVWEWCLNSQYEDLDITSERQRAVQGGSYIGAHERAQINFSFDLNPDYHYGSIGFRIACAF